MNIVFISPHFPSNFRHFCARLHQKGVNVLGIDQVQYEHLGHPLHSSLKDYYQVSDLHNYSELVDALDYFIKKYGPIDLIESHNEYWLDTQARLASHFEIPGLGMNELEQIKRKSRMKEVFYAAGLTPAKGAVVQSFDHAINLVSDLGYPAMLKPDIGVGANGCFKVRSKSDLSDFFAKRPNQEYLMEEFIEGQIFSFDGLVDKEGTVIFSASHAYGAGIAEIVNHHLDQVYYSLRSIPSDLEQMGKKILQAYGVKKRFFHLEFFRKYSDSSLVPIEVNMRPPGGPTLDMCNFACDIDLYRVWAEMITGQLHGFSYERKYHCMTICRRFKNQYAHSHEQILDRARGLIVHYDSVAPIYYATMGDFYYVVRSPHLDELQDLQRYIHSR